MKKKKSLKNNDREEKLREIIKFFEKEAARQQKMLLELRKIKDKVWFAYTYKSLTSENAYVERFKEDYTKDIL